MDLKLLLPILNQLPADLDNTLLDYSSEVGPLKRELNTFCPEWIVSECPLQVSPAWTPVNVVVSRGLHTLPDQKVIETLRMINWLAISAVLIIVEMTKPWPALLDMHIADMIWTVHEETEQRLVISGARRIHRESDSE